jgi:hypothetical protein
MKGARIMEKQIFQEKDPRTSMITFSVSNKEKVAIKAAAAQAGVNISAYIRSLIKIGIEHTSGKIL